MKRGTEGMLLLVVGLIAGYAVTSGAYTAFVRPGLRWPLAAAAFALVVAGAHGLNDNHPDHHDDHGDAGGGHRHGSGRGLAVLVLLPMLVQLVVTPSGLGSAAASRVGSRTVADAERVELPPLPDPVDGAVELTMSDLQWRTSVGTVDQLAGQRLRLTGMVTREPDATDRYLLTRFAIGCCAADAVALQAVIVGVGHVPPTDTWVQVEARWYGDLVERDGVQLPVLTVSSQHETEVPQFPYEY